MEIPTQPNNNQTFDNVATKDCEGESSPVGWHDGRMEGGSGEKKLMSGFFNQFPSVYQPFLSCSVLFDLVQEFYFRASLMISTCSVLEEGW